MDAREGTRVASSEASGVMAGQNSYGSSMTNSSAVSPTSAGMAPTMRLPFSSMVPPGFKPTDSFNPSYHGDASSGMRPSGFSMSEPVKKKRGRPRKYGPDGSMALALTPMSSAPAYSNSPSTDPSMMKKRGRPPGSGKKQQLEALGSAGFAFTPHVITVKAGEEPFVQRPLLRKREGDKVPVILFGAAMECPPEFPDVASKIMAFSQQGSRTICILSANGAICNVTLRQPATSGGTVTYEGRFEIISLSGSFMLTENDGARSRSGGLSVSLAGSDGRVLGGGVAGMLMAATPVQVVVGSFIAEGKKPKAAPVKRDPTSASLQMAGSGAAALGSPASQGTSSESSDNPSSPLNHSTGTGNNAGQTIGNMPLYTQAGWAGSHSGNQHRHDANMKMFPN